MKEYIFVGDDGLVDFRKPESELTKEEIDPYMQIIHAINLVTESVLRLEDQGKQDLAEEAVEFLIEGLSQECGVEIEEAEAFLNEAIEKRRMVGER